MTTDDFCLSDGRVSSRMKPNETEDIETENLMIFIDYAMGTEKPTTVIDYAMGMENVDVTGDYISPRPSLASPAGSGDIELEVLGGWCGSFGHDVPGGEVADEECETWLAVADFEEPPRTDLEERTERKAKRGED